MISEQSNDASGDRVDDLGPWGDALRALFETVIPQDQWAGGWLGGVDRLLREHSGDFMSWASPDLILACEQLGDASRAGNGCAFAELSPSARAQLFENVAFDEGGKPLRPFATVIDVAMQGFYAGTREPAGWAMVGFQPEPSVALSEGMTQSGMSLNEISPEYDVVVVGAGAGGGVAAAELSAAGKTILLVDRSRPMTDRELRGNHLQGKRLQSYQVTAGAGSGSPRIWENEDGTCDLLPGDGDGGAYGLTAMTLGGGTRLWQGMSWRFLPEDFAMASVYGSPDGSTLADWPFGYDELAPYYDRIESELGVSGSIDHADARRIPRRVPYPMPPMPDDETRRALSAAADRLGWSSSPIPFAINTVPRDGRGACVRCAQCVGHACAVNAKNGTQNTFIPRALRTGRCDLLLSVGAGSRDRAQREWSGVWSPSRRCHLRGTSGEVCACKAAGHCCWCGRDAAPAAGVWARQRMGWTESPLPRGSTGLRWPQPAGQDLDGAGAFGCDPGMGA